MKQIVSRTLERLYFEGGAELVVKYLSDYIEKYSIEGYTDLAIIYDYSYHDHEINLVGKRLETDKEYKVRTETEERFVRGMEASEARERKEYKRLKKKYDK